MERKIFFLDMDATTLRDDKSIPVENITAIREALDRGHCVTIATGRTWVSTEPLARRLGMRRKGCYLIACNGASVYDLENGGILQKKMFPDEYARYLFAEAEEANLYMQAYSETEFLARQVCPELEFYAWSSSMDYRIVPDLYHLENYDTPKVLLLSLDNRPALEQFQRNHIEWEKGRCVSFFSSPQYLEYCRMDCTKATGMKFLENYLYIAHENTIAIGDEENDLTMIREAGIGVAMKNARENIRNEADYVTKKDNNEGGVSEVIRKYM
ncbi:MAG: Cof-type HAD-IIB family hydrolase [Clostridiales bacterium]|nr:Cof-type HAD-IIB family hydrolase [Clostridiales bacterium]